MKSGAVLVLCPASVLAQWLREFRAWWPLCRVMLLHESGNHIMPNNDIINMAVEGGAGHVVITTYESFRRNSDIILSKHWGYAILDEVII